MKRIIATCEHYDHESYNAGLGYGLCSKYGVVCYQFSCDVRKEITTEIINQRGGVPKPTEGEQKACGHYVNEICDCERM